MFGLAYDLKMTVAELKQRMSFDEFQHWRAFYRMREKNNQ